jgi:nucleoside-diphosphate-sugar epimerase
MDSVAPQATAESRTGAGETPRRILVTGAAGFIGSHVVRSLLAAGQEVGVVIRPGASLARLIDVAERLTVFPCDLATASTLRPVLVEWPPQACIHLAWYVEPGKHLTAPENVAAVTASLGLLDELIRAGCRRVVMAGTSAEYDTDPGYLREDGPLRPLTLYGSSKAALSFLARQIAADAGVDLVWARIFQVFGPYEDERRVIPALIRSLMRGEPFAASAGDQIRDYMHVADVATALTALAERGPAGTVNVCSGVPVTMRYLMETVGDIVGSTELIRFGAVPYRDWDPPFVCGDNRRLRAQTGWQPRYPILRAGLTQTVDWWKAQPGA